MPKYIKHYIQYKEIQKYKEKKNRKKLMLNYLKIKTKRTLTFARQKSRCIITGRGKSYNQKFKISRHSVKKILAQGKIPGLILSSW